MENPKWKKFEELVYSIQKELAGDAEIKLDDSIINIQKSAINFRGCLTLIKF